MLPLQARVDLGVMAIKGNSKFPKAPALLEPHHHLVSYPEHLWERGLLYIDLRLGQAVKIRDAPVYITDASSRGISGYDLDCRGVELSAKL